ncbi:transcriptional repressor [Apiotrichum porosum]|uniref:Transcriptional repressor n=1 Tax=Apiotrichum porosum TaxID=105984 RepID=A0A427XN05_9TREE|nr:transcriptional repressor [Apiotrichum porosum]RSH80291.1 transcriptional repressor [Apiotrichum porosum]
MSTDASPQHPGHMSSAYGQPPMGQGPPPQLSNLNDSGNRSYQDSEPSGSGAQSAPSAPESPAVPPPTKGKNGATGPAEGKPKPHVCPICQRGFTTGGHLQRHQRIHTGIKAFKCPYPGCETRTSRQDNLQQHYRTHLSPTLRRGSGTAARQAVAAAMMAAGLKSTNSRQPRKSKGSQVGTPGSSSGTSVAHGQSPYQTPTQAAAPYGGYMYDPSQHGYASYPPLPPPGVGGMAQPQSAQSSRVPSPVNGHSNTNSMPSAHHQQFYSQQFSPAYAGGYPGSNYGQPYRYGPQTSMPSPYGGGPPSSHHSMYSPGMAPGHDQQHMYSPLQNNYAQHSRDSQYSVITQGGYASQAPMSNGFPARTQSSTPLSQAAHDELDPRYRGTAPRAQSPRGRRLTPPQQAEMIAPSVVEHAPMSTSTGQNAAPRASYGNVSQQQQYAYPASNGGGYAYNAGGMTQSGRDGAPALGAHRTTVSSLTEDTDSKGRV